MRCLTFRKSLIQSWNILFVEKWWGFYIKTPNSDKFYRWCCVGTICELLVNIMGSEAGTVGLPLGTSTPRRQVWPWLMLLMKLFIHEWKKSSWGAMLVQSQAKLFTYNLVFTLREQNWSLQMRLCRHLRFYEILCVNTVTRIKRIVAITNCLLWLCKLIT